MTAEITPPPTLRCVLCGVPFERPPDGRVHFFFAPGGARTGPFCGARCGEVYRAARAEIRRLRHARTIARAEAPARGAPRRKAW